MRAPGSGGGFTTAKLVVFPVVFRSNRRLVDISKLHHDYDEYRGVNVNPEQAGGVDLDALFDQDLLWA